MNIPLEAVDVRRGGSPAALEPPVIADRTSAWTVSAGYVAAMAVHELPRQPDGDDIDLLDPRAVADPHAYLAPFRDTDPVTYSERHRAWMILGHREVAAAFRDPRLSTERMEAFRNRLEDRRAMALARAIELLDGWMLFHEPPTHTRLRAPLVRSFTPRATARLRPQIEAITDRLLDAVAETGGIIDLVTMFSHPLPSEVIAELFGVPAELHEWMAAWSDNFGVVVFGATRRPDYEEVARAAGDEFTGIIGDLVDRYRQAPEDNLLSLLLADESHPGGLTTTEMVGACSLLLFAGHDTTASLLGAATAALLRHPEQIPHLSAGPPPAVACAVEELLRYEPPAKAMTRIVVEDHERDGHQFTAGQNVYLAILAANRDPRAFASPHRLDLTRTPNPHLSFGFGHHFCLGASLARLEASVALGRLFRRFPDLALAGEPTWNATISDRSPTSVPVSLNH